MKHLPSLFTGPVRVLLVLITFVSASACQVVDMAQFAYANASVTPEWATEQHTTTVPFTMVDNHIIVPVRVNGSEPMRFVLDSGAAATVIIDSRATRALKLETKGELTVSGVGNGPDPVAYIVPDTRFSMGTVSLPGHSAIFLPLDSIPFFDDLDHVYFDGVIGAPFFTRFVVQIDHESQMVSFSEPGVVQDYIENLDESWHETELEIASGVPYAVVQFDSGQMEPIDLKLLVDTGARSALSLTPDTDRGLQAPNVYIQTVSDGLSGEVISHLSVADSVALGGYAVQPVPVSYALEGGESDADSNGILGNEFLQQFNIIFDYSQQRLFLAPNRFYGTPIELDRSGLQIRPHAEGGIVKRIGVGSSAQDSMIEVGDVITSFESHPVSHENIRELKRALASDRDSVNMCWQSQGEQRCEELVLASRLDASRL